jgi:pimeloyl-ACP methyl ester carboxylesterase
VTVEPPVALPPGRLVAIPGRGELFVRDTGGEGPPLLLLHGWLLSADVNWWPMYEPLRAAGWRVLAPDHRGHGRGLRSPAPFRLADCAADAAALLAAVASEPAVAVGYSLGGPVAQLRLREHPEAFRGLVFCATALDWQDAYLRVVWASMGLLRLALGLAPTLAWDVLLRLDAVPAGPQRRWLAAELSRGSAADLAHAGRELGRYDARGWISSLRRVPSAVVVTTRDWKVPPRKQLQLAEALGAPRFPVAANHYGIVTRPREFEPALLGAIRAVGGAA